MARKINTNKQKIYKLIDPISKEIRYIGITGVELIMRLVGHIKQLEANYLFKDKNEWILSLLKINLCPIIGLIEEVDAKIATDRERYWINFYKQNNNLLNIMKNENKLLSKRLSEAMSKKIFEYGLDGNFIREWNSIIEAAKYHNAGAGNISLCLNNKNNKKKCANRQWSFEKVDKLPPYKRVYANQYGVY